MMRICKRCRLEAGWQFSWQFLSSCKVEHRRHWRSLRPHIEQQAQNASSSAQERFQGLPAWLAAAHLGAWVAAGAGGGRQHGVAATVAGTGALANACRQQKELGIGYGAVRGVGGFIKRPKAHSCPEGCTDVASSSPAVHAVVSHLPFMSAVMGTGSARRRAGRHIGSLLRGRPQPSMGDCKEPTARAAHCGWH